MDRLYNEGDLVYLIDLAPNRYICEKVNLDIINKVGIVKEIEIEENVEMSAIYDDLIVFMRNFPLWNKV
ncbi:MAG: hypothetical protein GX889_04860 [Clostridiales bacterium]|nr:hypothetical protein [Clostridiales bacterium]